VELLQRDKLVRGGLYTVTCRNLEVAVYDGGEGFIGIRDKVGARYLFTEYLSRACGGTQLGSDTCRPEVLLMQVPNGIELRENLGEACRECKKPVWWTGPPAPAEWACQSGCKNVMPEGLGNTPLFDFLDSYLRERQIRAATSIKAFYDQTEGSDATDT
jgi:hypothetical protein